MNHTREGIGLNRMVLTNSMERKDSNDMKNISSSSFLMSYANGRQLVTTPPPNHSASGFGTLIPPPNDEIQGRPLLQSEVTVSRGQHGQPVTVRAVLTSQFLRFYMLLTDEESEASGIEPGGNGNLGRLYLSLSLVSCSGLDMSGTDSFTINSPAGRVEVTCRSSLERQLWQRKLSTTALRTVSMPSTDAPVSQPVQIVSSVAANAHFVGRNNDATGYIPPTNAVTSNTHSAPIARVLSPSVQRIVVPQPTPAATQERPVKPRQVDAQTLDGNVLNASPPAPWIPPHYRHSSRVLSGRQPNKTNSPQNSTPALVSSSQITGRVNRSPDVRSEFELLHTEWQSPPLVIADTQPVTLSRTQPLSSTKSKPPLSTTNSTPGSLTAVNYDHMTIAELRSMFASNNDSVSQAVSASNPLSDPVSIVDDPMKNSVSNGLTIKPKVVVMSGDAGKQSGGLTMNSMRAAAMAAAMPLPTVSRTNSVDLKNSSEVDNAINLGSDPESNLETVPIQRIPSHATSEISSSDRGSTTLLSGTTGWEELLHVGKRLVQAFSISDATTFWVEWRGLQALAERLLPSPSWLAVHARQPEDHSFHAHLATIRIEAEFYAQLAFLTHISISDFQPIESSSSNIESKGKSSISVTAANITQSISRMEQTRNEMRSLPPSFIPTLEEIRSLEDELAVPFELTPLLAPFTGMRTLARQAIVSFLAVLIRVMRPACPLTISFSTQPTPVSLQLNCISPCAQGPTHFTFAPPPVPIASVPGMTLSIPSSSTAGGAAQSFTDSPLHETSKADADLTYFGRGNYNSDRVSHASSVSTVRVTGTQTSPRASNNSVTGGGFFGPGSNSHGVASNPIMQPSLSIHQNYAGSMYPPYPASNDAFDGNAEEGDDEHSPRPIHSISSFPSMISMLTTDDASLPHPSSSRPSDMVDENNFIDEVPELNTGQVVTRGHRGSMYPRDRSRSFLSESSGDFGRQGGVNAAAAGSDSQSDATETWVDVRALRFFDSDSDCANQASPTRIASLVPSNPSSRMHSLRSALTSSISAGIADSETYFTEASGVDMGVDNNRHKSHILDSPPRRQEEVISPVRRVHNREENTTISPPSGACGTITSNSSTLPEDIDIDASYS